MNDLLTFVLVVAVAVFLWRLATRGQRPQTPQQRLARLHRQLLAMNMGDADVVRRLVEYERERRPGLSDTGCYRAAIGRMRR